MYKKSIKKLQEEISKKYPNFKAKFYINRKNRLIHIGMDQSLYDFSNYRLFLWDCQWYFEKIMNQQLFHWYRIPNLISCTKWKYDYVCAIRMADEWDYYYTY